MRTRRATLERRKVPRLRAGVALVGTCLVCACGDSGRRPDGASTPAVTTEPGPQALAEVHGRWTTSWWSEAGTYEEPVDLSATLVHALVRRAESVQVFVGHGESNGTFVVPGVPDVPFSLRIGDVIYENVAREVTLASQGVGRIDAAYLPRGQSIAIHLNNLVPGQTNVVDVMTMNAGGVWHLTEADVQAGQTRIDDGYACDGETVMAVDAARGDRSVVLGYRVDRTTQGLLLMQRLSRVLDVPALSIQDGARVEGAMSDVPQTSQATVDWRGAAFANAIAPATVLAEPPEAIVQIGAVPVGAPILRGRSSLGWSAAPIRVPSLLTVAMSLADASPSFTFGNPFEGWETWIRSSVSTRIRRDVTWAHGDRHTVPFEWMSIDQVDALAPDGRPELRPRIGPVVDVRVNGSDGFDEQSHVGPTPTIAWSPGVRPSDAEVRFLVELDGVEGYYGNAAPAFKVWTTSTSVTLPSGFLVDGTYYIVRISAFPAVGARFADAPLRQGLFDRSRVMLGLLRP